MDPISRLLNLFENGIISKEDLSNGMCVLRQQAEAKVAARPVEEAAAPTRKVAPALPPKKVAPALPPKAVVNSTHFTDDEIDQLIDELIPDDLDG